MRTPSSALPAWPKGFFDGGGNSFEATDIRSFFLDLPLAFFALPVFLIAGFSLALIFDLVAISPSPLLTDAPHVRRCGRLFLLQRALRIEVADAAALAAGCRIDHRVDQRRFAGIQSRVNDALELVGRGRVDADTAE